MLSLARVSRNVFCKEVVARSAGSMLIVGFDPGACAPGFMLSPAPQVNAMRLDKDHAAS